MRTVIGLNWKLEADQKRRWKSGVRREYGG